MQFFRRFNVFLVERAVSQQRVDHEKYRIQIEVRVIGDAVAQMRGNRYAQQHCAYPATQIVPGHGLAVDAADDIGLKKCQG
ncbi:hypothetical protein [Rubrivivax gelatinosus]|uniref:hypothetical protein n=1 Tax=Rubrivivax gelatinosus TaxID=28068 RepID=UPI0012FE672C|nr:hypothetical protein [Rubrivivax gelatinosus]